MIPTEILVHEHEKIEQVLKCLEHLVNRCVSENVLEKDRVRDCVTFFKQFADGTHHKKEEDLLFPLIVERGIPRENGPVGVMLFEHEKGREYLKGILDALDEEPNNGEAARSRFVENASGYIRLLREHIRKENHCLFPMADQVLNQEDRESLASAFHDFDSSETSAQTLRECVELADRIAGECGIEITTVSLRPT